MKGGSYSQYTNHWLEASMRKMIFLAVAGFLWRKLRSRMFRPASRRM
jgi:hypothetical protein